MRDHVGLFRHPRQVSFIKWSVCRWKAGYSASLVDAKERLSQKVSNRETFRPHPM